MPKQARRHYGQLIFPVLLCLAAAGINIYFALPLLPGWFAKLVKPSVLPPDPESLFVILLLVYLVITGSVFLIWRAKHMDPQDQLLCLALAVFAIILTGLWGYLFFALESPIMGVMISVLVVSMFIATMVQSIKVSFGATLLLSPVVILMFLLAYANYMIVQLNPSLPVFGI